MGENNLIKIAVLMLQLSCLMICQGFLPSIYRDYKLAHPRSSNLLNMVIEKRIESVPKSSEKQRIDVYLSTVMPSRSRSFLGDLCDKGLVTVNDKKVTKSFKVVGGDVISMEIEEKEVSKVTPEDIPLDILYEDDDIIAINKPQGMVVHPAPGSPNNTFVNALLFHLGPSAQRLLESVDLDVGHEVDGDLDEDVDLPETPEAAVASHVSLRPGVVHRLDKGTSGVLLAGKHPEAVAKLSALFAARKVNKVYLAVCIGHPGEATIVEPIGRSQKNRQLMTVYNGPPGKPAVTHVRTLAFDGKLSVALVRIETGRTHQIRVHLKERRTPIAGDEAYGNNDWNKKLAKSDAIHRPLLHAYETQIQHPFNGEMLTFRAPLPKDMASLVGKLSPTSPLLDNRSLLVGATPDVEGRGPGEQGKGFVPMDRLAFQEEHWTSYDLPESPMVSNDGSGSPRGPRRKL